MVAVQDFFVPRHAQEALEESGRYVEEERELAPGVRGLHLRTDVGVVRTIGQALRRRAARSPRLSVKPEGLAERLAGVRLLVSEFASRDSASRRELMELLPRITGFPREMIAVILSSLEALLSGDAEQAPGLPTNAAAGRYVPRGSGYVRYFPGRFGFSLSGMLAGIGLANRAITVLPLTGLPRVVANVAAGNVPGIALLQAFYSVAVGAASIGKNSSAEPCFATAVMEGARRLEQERGLFPLTDFMAVVTFTREDRPALSELIAQGDHLQVTGGLDARREVAGIVRHHRLRRLRHLRRRVTGNWHKVSFDLVTAEMLELPDAEMVAHGVAMDNSMFNTQGCLSAQQVFVEGPVDRVLEFAGTLATRMAEVADRLPKGEDPTEGLREMYTHYEGKPGCAILTRLGEMAEHPFFVACDTAPREFGVFNALNRSILVRRIPNVNYLAEMLRRVPDRDLLQSCGLAVGASRLLSTAEMLGRAGVTRIVSVGDIWTLRPDLDSWDGNLKPLDLIAPKLGYWTTLRFRDPRAELAEVYQRNRRLLAEGADL